MSVRPEVNLASWRGSVFWRVAAALFAVQLLAVAVAIGLSASNAYDRALELAGEGLRLRVDQVAEELEIRADWEGAGLQDLPPALLSDLSARFPDPLIIVDASGQPLLAAQPDGRIDTLVSGVLLSSDVAASLASGAIDMSRDRTWMAAPVFDDVGFLAGGIVISPLGRSLNRELAPARTALVQALSISGIVVLAVALLLAAVFTLRLVGPLRQMTRQVEAIGEGDYDQRVEFGGEDELGRLADTINRMATRVAHSIEELQATDRMRRELVANVGHDLRTPLAALLGRIDESNRMLADGRVELAHDHLENARRQAAYLKGLIDDLFELAILETPTPPLRREPVPVGELIQDAVSQHRDALVERGVRLEVVIEKDLPLMRADGVRLIRLLNNLISNAGRHTPDEGSIRVTAGRDADTVVIEVRDSGPGLEEENLEHLFDRYYRGTDARTRKSDGTGLGLPISRAIATAHRGSLTAMNAEVGGAVFRLTLPLGNGEPNEKGPALDGRAL